MILQLLGAEDGCRTVFIPFSGTPPAVHGSRPSDDTKDNPKVRGSTAWRAAGGRAAGSAAPRGTGPGRSRPLPAPPGGDCGPPRAGRAAPRSAAHTGRWRKRAGRGQLVCSSERTIKLQSLKEEEKKKHPTPLGSPSRGGLQPGWSSRGPAPAEAWRARGAGMGVTVEVHQVYKYPFEQVVASFLRKVPPGSAPGPLLPRLLRPPAVRAPTPAWAAGPPLPSPRPVSAPRLPWPLSSPPALCIPRVPSGPPSAPHARARTHHLPWRRVLCWARVEVSSKAPPSGRGKATCAASHSLWAAAAGRGLWGRVPGNPSPGGPWMWYRTCHRTCRLASTSRTPEKRVGVVSLKPSSWFSSHSVYRLPSCPFIQQLWDWGQMADLPCALVL